MPGPFTSYVPPGVFTRTIFEPAVNTLLDSLRLPVFIGIGQETLIREDYELIRGSSAVSDNLITKEDVNARWVVDDSNPASPVLGAQDGTLRQFQVRHSPLVTGNGQGTTTSTPTDVLVFVNGDQVTVGAVNGAQGLVTLVSFVRATDDVTCTYYFNREDTEFTDDVSDQADGTNTDFKIYNVPIVDGTNGGILSTNVNDVSAEVDGVVVTVSALDAAGGVLTFQTAPSGGSTVLITYFHNTWQNTFDYLVDTGITDVIRVGVAPQDASFIQDTDYVVRDDLIYWGASFRISSVIHTGGAEFFDDTQISVTLVDTRVHRDETVAWVDPDTSITSDTIFRLTYQPTVGNGRDTTLGQDTFNAISNGKIAVVTDRPELITAYVGVDVQDAMQRTPVTVLEVDGTNRLITLDVAVQANETVFATYTTNFLRDDTHTLTTVLAGASGAGTYTVGSELFNDEVLQARFIGKTAISQTLNWDTGNESLLGIFHDGSGLPIEEYVKLTTVTNVARAATLLTSVAGPWAITLGVNDGLSVDPGTGAVAIVLTPSTPAVVTGTSVETFDLDGLTLSIKVDGEAIFQDVLFVGNTLTAAAVAIQVDAQTTGITSADDGGGLLEMTTDAVGSAAIIQIGGGTANVELGLSASTTTGANTPLATVASDIDTALGVDGTAVVEGTGVRISSAVVGLAATLTVGTGTANVTVGLTAGQTDGGEDAFTTYTVASFSDAAFTIPTTNGSGTGTTTTGTVGQTFIDDVTGLRISLLAPTDAAAYDDAGEVELLVSATFVADSTGPIYAIPGTEVLVTNTTSIAVGDTAEVETFDKAGNEPSIGDFYYITYRFAKTDFNAKVFTSLKDVVREYGALAPENRLTLAISLAIQNGALLVAGKQVVAQGPGLDAATQDYITAIDELRKPIERRFKPAVIVPVTTDPEVIAFTKTHCIVQSSIRYRNERICFFGFAIGTEPNDASRFAQSLASNRMIGIYPDSAVIGLVDENGIEQEHLLDGSFLAASVAGSNVSPAFDVATPMTFRQIVGFSRTQRLLDEVEMNQIAVSGLTVLEDLDPNIRVRHFLTTDMSGVLTREPTVTTTADHVQQVMRQTLRQFIGVKFLGAITSDIERVVKSTMQSLVLAEIITKFSNVTARPDPSDATAVQVELVYVPVFPLNYIVVTFSLRSR